MSTLFVSVLVGASCSAVKDSQSASKRRNRVNIAASELLLSHYWHMAICGEIGEHSRIGGLGGTLGPTKSNPNPSRHAASPLSSSIMSRAATYLVMLFLRVCG